MSPFHQLFDGFTKPIKELLYQNIPLFKNGTWMRYFCFLGYNFAALSVAKFFPLLPQIVIVFSVYVFSLSTNWGHGQNSDWEWVVGLETIYMKAEQL